MKKTLLIKVILFTLAAGSCSAYTIGFLTQASNERQVDSAFVQDGIVYYKSDCKGISRFTTFQYYPGTTVSIASTDGVELETSHKAFHAGYADKPYFSRYTSFTKFSTYMITSMIEWTDTNVASALESYVVPTIDSQYSNQEIWPMRTTPSFDADFTFY